MELNGSGMNLHLCLSAVQFVQSQPVEVVLTCYTPNIA